MSIKKTTFIGYYKLINGSTYGVLKRPALTLPQTKVSAVSAVISDIPAEIQNIVTMIEDNQIGLVTTINPDVETQLTAVLQTLPTILQTNGLPGSVKLGLSLNTITGELSLLLTTKQGTNKTVLEIPVEQPVEGGGGGT